MTTVMSLEGMQVPNSKSKEIYRLPASYAQQALWYVVAASPHCAAYELVTGYHIVGALEHGKLKQAIQLAVDNNESLRTVFEESESQISQLFAEQIEASIFEQSVATLTEARVAITEVLSQRMSLTTGPLFETHLFSIQDSNDRPQTALFFRLHHIIVDQTSITLLLEEIAGYYHDLLALRPPNTQTKAMDFGDFSTWQVEEKTKAKVSERLGFWTERITEPTGCIDLPLDHPRPRLQSFEGAEFKQPLAQRTVKCVQEFSQQNALSAFNTYLAAFAELLRRYSRQPQIIVGVPFANRSDDDDLENVVGLLMNTLPVPFDSNTDLSFVEQVKVCNEMLRQLQGLQDVPLQHVVEALPVVRDPSYSPLYQVGFAMQPKPQVLSIEQCQTESLNVHAGGAPYDLQVWVLTDENGDSELQIWYDTVIFSEATIKRLADNYEALLHALTEDANSPLKAVPLMTARDASEVVTYQGEVIPEPGHRNVASFIFSKDRDWQQTAVISGGEALTHEQLKKLSYQFANCLSAQNISALNSVGILLERGPSLLPCLLGLLASNIAYTPMDPDYPIDLLNFVIADSKVSHLIVSRSVVDKISVPQGTTIITLEDIWDDVLTQPADWQIPSAPRDPAAYVIYTSGSTGKPKGVVVGHASVINFLGAMARKPGLTPQERLLAVTTLSFDISVLELYGPISVGGSVVISTKDDSNDPKQLASLISEYNIGLMQATPSTWNMLLEAQTSFPATFRAFCGGEPLPIETARALKDRVQALWNLYGPTETTVWSSAALIEDAANITIGEPIQNTQLYVFNEQLQALPLGIPGELYIGGSGLAHGYLDRSELTSDRFIPHPDFPDQRLYRTGDLVRYNAQGQLMHLGRLDQQVKIRGFRVELGQIETVLIESPRIEDAVVYTKEVSPGDLRLVAYVVPQKGDTLSSNELRKLVRSQVPEYMVPQFFVLLESIPKTANGKIDRNALPPLDSTAFSSGYVAPESPTELAIAGIWERLIGGGKVGRSDNFFAAGGHSMLAFSALLEINEYFGTEIKLPILLINNLREISQLIDQSTKLIDTESQANSSAQEESEGANVKPKTAERGTLGRFVDSLLGSKS